MMNLQNKMILENEKRNQSTDVPMETVNGDNTTREESQKLGQNYEFLLTLILTVGRNLLKSIPNRLKLKPEDIHA